MRKDIAKILGTTKNEKEDSRHRKNENLYKSEQSENMSDTIQIRRVSYGLKTADLRIF